MTQAPDLKAIFAFVSTKSPNARKYGRDKAVSAIFL